MAFVKAGGGAAQGGTRPAAGGTERRARTEIRRVGDVLDYLGREYEVKGSASAAGDIMSPSVIDFQPASSACARPHRVGRPGIDPGDLAPQSWQGLGESPPPHPTSRRLRPANGDERLGSQANLSAVAADEYLTRARFNWWRVTSAGRAPTSPGPGWRTCLTSWESLVLRRARGCGSRSMVADISLVPFRAGAAIFRRPRVRIILSRSDARRGEWCHYAECHFRDAGSTEKFGGTSVADLERIRNVAGRVKRRSSQATRWPWWSRPWPARPTSWWAGSRALDARGTTRANTTWWSPTGEQVTVGLLAMALQPHGRAGALLAGLAVPIRTDERPRQGAHRGSTAEMIRRLRRGEVAVVAGFQGVARRPGSPRWAAAARTPRRWRWRRR